MPEICRFFGIVIKIFFDEHNPPHFHAEYGEHRASIRISDYALLEGYLPPKTLGLVIEWAAIHRNELIDNWELACQKKSLFKIKPLE